ncbi:MAG: polysaccharide deacetylase family protein [Sulfuricella sp.]|nr:polysaccharide deacetylase family protein [Sulfuricella sp.]
MAHKLGSLASLALRGVGSLIARTGGRGRLSILVYHRVLARADAMFAGEVDAAVFGWQMALLAEHFQVLPLPEAVRRLRDGTLPPRAACVTFDDGYADNHDVALPILQKWQLPATFFVATAYLDGGWMWNDAVIEAVRQAPGQHLDLAPLGLPACSIATPRLRRKAAMTVIARLKYLPPDRRQTDVWRMLRLASAKLPASPMMSSSQVRALHSAGMEIGGHTVSHPILAGLDSAAAYAEIADGKAQLEQISGGAVQLFAYPNGKPGKDYRHEHVEMVKRSGFAAAVSTAWGAAGAGGDSFQLPRFTPWDGTPLRFGLRLLQNARREGELVGA